MKFVKSVWTDLTLLIKSYFSFKFNKLFKSLSLKSSESSKYLQNEFTKRIHLYKTNTFNIFTKHSIK
jgi:hypothetical protein